MESPLASGLDVTGYNFGTVVDGLHHLGIDVHAPAGTPVVAPMDLFIVYSANHPPRDGRGNWGGLAVANAADGSAGIVLGHLDPTRLPALGRVSRGEVVGYIARREDTGFVPHLHFQLTRSALGAFVVPGYGPTLSIWEHPIRLLDEIAHRPDCGTCSIDIQTTAPAEVQPGDSFMAHWVSTCPDPLHVQLLCNGEVVAAVHNDAPPVGEQRITVYDDRTWTEGCVFHVCASSDSAWSCAPAGARPSAEPPATPSCTSPSRRCGSDVGACQSGVSWCDARTGEWGGCAGAVGPVAETCNGVDDDCDGETDEEAGCGAPSPPPPPSESDSIVVAVERAETLRCTTSSLTAWPPPSWASLSSAPPLTIPDPGTTGMLPVRVGCSDSSSALGPEHAGASARSLGFRVHRGAADITDRITACPDTWGGAGEVRLFVPAEPGLAGCP